MAQQKYIYLLSEYVCGEHLTSIMLFGDSLSGYCCYIVSHDSKSNSYLVKQNRELEFLD
jgi:hypothetical protein